MEERVGTITGLYKEDASKVDVNWADGRKSTRIPTGGLSKISKEAFVALLLRQETADDGS